MQLFKEANRMLDLLDRDYEVKTLFKLCKANADGDNLIIEKEKRPIRHLSFTASADAQKEMEVLSFV